MKKLISLLFFSVILIFYGQLNIYGQKVLCIKNTKSGEKYYFYKGDEVDFSTSSYSNKGDQLMGFLTDPARLILQHRLTNQVSVWVNGKFVQQGHEQLGIHYTTTNYESPHYEYKSAWLDVIDTVRVLAIKKIVLRTSRLDFNAKKLVSVTKKFKLGKEWIITNDFSADQ
ncbi:MAG: hypothetical protein NTX61_16105 [Bacteroidetes bacterium]|nr:hypothetical protein [Bacteroidota bacterium]